MKYLVEQASRVIEWNDKAGVKNQEVYTKEWWEALKLQSKLIVEEANESLTGSITNDATELLDGIVDVFVVHVKAMDMLQKAGFNVEGAIAAVMDNNELKIYDSYYLAVEEKEKLENANVLINYYIETTYHKGLPFYTVRREDGKIAKSVDHPKVDLSQFVPVKEVK